MYRSVLIPLCLLAACNNKSENNEDGEVVDCSTLWFPDADADGFGDAALPFESCELPAGYVANSLDCNDANAQIFPGAPEADCADPTDYNCDGSSGYADADGDARPACEDCDDSNALVFPDAAEICDGLDNDCNGVADYPAVDATDWFIDYDSDGYGDARYTLSQCDQPVGYVDNDDDCNDVAAAAHPGGEETCDSLDNDCDGLVDPGTATGAVIVYDDLDGDTYGDPLSETSTCYPDEDQIFDAQDCDDADAATNPEALELCNDGIDNDCDGGPIGCEQVLLGTELSLQGSVAGDYAGVAFDVGDWNGDGQLDLLMGASSADIGTAGSEGAAYLFWGPLPASGALSTSAADIIFAGSTGGSVAGSVLRNIGDFNADGRDDLAIAASKANDGDTASGSVYVFLGTTVAALSGTVDLAEGADKTWTGNDAYDWFGTGMAGLGDFDGDGDDDFVVGATGDEVGGRAAGSVYLIKGWSSFTGGGARTVSTVAAATLTGESTDQYAGAALGGLGDLDGDGLPELGVGVVQSSRNGNLAGTAYILSSPLSGTLDLGASVGLLNGAAVGDRLGAGMEAAGDLDGDGYADLWIGATREDSGAADAGAIYLVGGTASLDSLYDQLISAVALSTFTGAETGDGIGASFATGDWDGDGAADLLVGSPNAGLNGEGRTALVLGPLPTAGTQSVGDAARAVLVGNAPNDHSGGAVGFGGDLFGTGGPGSALLVGAWEDNAVGADAGALSVVSALAL